MRVQDDRGRPDPWSDLVEGTITAGGRDLRFVHPREIGQLVDEEAFEENEYLPYWAQLWPSGIVLARTVAASPIDGAHVLEIGCGIGLPSIAAALSGARVLATDWSSDAIAFTATNAARNGAAVETAVCSWADPGPMVARAVGPGPGRRRALRAAVRLLAAGAASPAGGPLR